MVFTSNQGRVSVSIPGVTIDNVSWDKFDGGGRSADTQNYPPGGMQPSIATGGVTKRGQTTIERAWDDTLIGAYMALDAAVNGPIACSLTPLRNASTPVPEKPGGFNYTGVLREVTRPPFDSTSSAIGKLVIVAELNEVMA